MNKPFKLDIELIIKISPYGWFYYSVHQYNDGLLRLIKRNDLQEIVITNVIELQSRTNTSKKFPRSGINIIHEGQQIFHAPCIGVEQFCKPYQLTTLPSNTTVVLLWTRNVLDVPDKGVKNGLIKEIKSPTGEIVTNGDREINEYLSLMREKFFIGWIFELFAFTPLAWILISAFFEYKSNKYENNQAGF